MMIWTKDKAKKYMVNYHFLNSQELLEGHDGVRKIFNRLKSIQYDPLDVVGRNADLVLQARISNYSKQLLQDALYKERYLIDGWDKMMGIYQTSDFAFMEPVRIDRTEGEVNRLEYHGLMEALDIIDDVFEELKEGPKFSSEIKIGEINKSRWGHSKASSLTLDYLFHRGDIGVRVKKGALKQFDLIDNLIDVTYAKDSINFPKEYMLRRIYSMGLVWNKSSVAWSGPFIGKKVQRNKLLKELLEDNVIKEVQIEGVKECFYIPTEFADLDVDVVADITFIAPLDNFIWDRALIKEIFDFDYKWEVYTPLKQRKFGYYVLPMLLGTSFVGRIEFKHFRGSELEVINVFWEDKPNKRALNKAIKLFEKYLRKGEV